MQEPLGIMFEEYEDVRDGCAYLVCAGVVAGSQAAALPCPPQAGAVLLSIDGTAPEAMAPETLKEALQKRPLHLVFTAVVSTPDGRGCGVPEPGVVWGGRAAGSSGAVAHVVGGGGRAMTARAFVPAAVRSPRPPPPSADGSDGVGGRGGFRPAAVGGRCSPPTTAQQLLTPTPPPQRQR